MRSKNAKHIFYLCRDILVIYSTTFSPNIFAVVYSEDWSFPAKKVQPLSPATDGSFSAIFFMTLKQLSKLGEKCSQDAYFGSNTTIYCRVSQIPKKNLSVCLFFFTLNIITTHFGSYSTPKLCFQLQKFGEKNLK